MITIRQMRHARRQFDRLPHFGWNWAAFDECIRDLSWLPAKAYLAIVRHGEQLLRDDADELPTFRHLMEAAGRYWAHALP
jgi:hypothetical protein